jgi:hypothetical protein
VARAALLLITAGALAACGSSAASSSVTIAATSGALAHCGPAGARTLARGPQVRVYAEHGTVYGCRTGSSRRVRLGTTGSCLRASRVDRVAVAGPLVAAAVTRCGVDTGQAEVEVVRLPSSRPLYSHLAVGNPGPESFSTVRGLVLTGRGAVAWIARSNSILSHRANVEVQAGNAAQGTRQLDSGPQVAVGSLRLSGNTVSWRHGSVRRSARL